MYSVLKQAIDVAPEKAISYSAYMNIVLYDPIYGYYMKDTEKIGRKGDFFTSSNVSSIFAKQFAALFIQLVKDKIVPPAICEIGGGTGQFAYDVLTEWKHQSPNTFSQLTYVLVEKSPYHQQLQQKLLQKFSNVKSCTSIRDIKSFEGIVFSNELFDAFPVDVIEQRDKCLYEVYVTYGEQDELLEEFRLLQNSEIIRYLQSHHLQLQNGQRFEVPLAMGNYLQEMGKWFQKGLCITVDYGYTNEEWMNPVHREGSLRGYYKHQLIRNVLKYSGDMDLTTHIHWDELKRVGQLYGLETVLQTKQTNFLLATGILERLVSHDDYNPFSEQNKKNRAIRSMILQGGMSDSFDVVIQQKALEHFEISNYLNTTFLNI